MAYIMQSRKQEELVATIRSKFPQVFGYEYAAVLFYDSTDEALFCFTNSSKSNNISTKDQKIVLPVGIGLTGLAINNKKTMFFEQGENDPNFQLEVDNTRQILDYDQVLVCPLYDFNGQLCGCLHLINKLDPETLPEKDEQDLQRISASIAELIHLLEVQGKVTEIAANLNKVMDNV